MDIKKILFPTDFSHTGDAALKMATSLARDNDAELLILHIAEPPVAYGGGGDFYYGPPTPSEDELNELLSKVNPEDEGVRCTHLLISGDPRTRIHEVAKEENADLIVMGTHGRTGFVRALMGSVSESVVRHSEIPVLTFKQNVEVPASSEE